MTTLKIDTGIPVVRLTERRLLILRRLGVEGMRPCYEELLAVTGLRSKSTLHNNLHALRRAGLVTWDADSQGTMRLTAVGRDLVTQLAA